MDLVIREISRLSDDYYKCPDFQLKQQILSDIALLKDALLLLKDETDSDLEQVRFNSHN